MTGSKKLKRGLYLPFLKKPLFCPGSVVAYHEALSRLRLGFKSQPGRFIKYLCVKKSFYNMFCYKKIVRRMKRVVITGLIFILLTSVFTFLCPIYIVKGATLNVGNGQTYSTIQAAINAANDNDVVYVHSGTYNENLVISKTINLTGVGSGSVTLSGSGDQTLKINNNSVQISGLTIKNTGGSYGCILLNSVTNCVITGNIIKNSGNGIYLLSSNSNTIENNQVQSNNIGIYLFGSDSNTIKSNDINNNNANGVFLDSSSGSNIIYLNDFSDNLDSNARDLGSNSWNYNSQGNYWDDYNDYDNNSDGIGDNPYTIDGSGGNKDNYPLGDFLSSNQQPVAYIDSISPNPGEYGDAITFNGHGTDDGSVVSWEWKSDGIIIGNSGSFSKSDLSIGSHTISFRVKDNTDTWSEYAYETLVISSINQKPVAYILEPVATLTKNYGDSIEFLGDWSDEGQVEVFSWRSSIDGIISSSLQFTKNDLSIGEHTIYFKIRDDYGEWSSEVSVGVNIIPNATSNPPFANTGGPYNGFVNQSITFDGSSSYDMDNGDSIASYFWDFGDGTTGYNVSVEHIYTTEGNYTVELTVTDTHGLQKKSSTYANISATANDQNGTDVEDKGTPGFEITIFLTAIVLILIFRNKKKKEKMF